MYLGIDLGTTNSVAVIYDDKKDSMTVVKIDGIDEVLPSVVRYDEDEIVVGLEAKSGLIIYPENTVVSVKRHMGTDKVFEFDDIKKTPEEISAEILKKLKEAATETCGENFNEVVITHPAYFNDKQIYATKLAGEMAGFETVHLLSEPLSSAIEYGFNKGYGQTLLVYDIGGGTFDACVLRVSKDEYGEEIYEELSDVGDMNLGGDDFDRELVLFMKNKFLDESGINLDDAAEEDKRGAEQKLLHEAEQVKKKLSASNKASVRIHPLIIIDGVPKNLSFDITKEEFEALIRKYVDKTREIVMEALSRANKEPDEISKVILVGGSTLIPMVKRTVAGFLKEPYRATDPAKSVAMGAAIYNYLIHLPNSSVKINQVTRQVFGTEAVVDLNTMAKKLIPIINMGTSIPCKITDNEFSNVSQTVNVPVYQWEHGKENDKKYIGSVHLTGLTQNSKIGITYSIDENNLFYVDVLDLATGKAERGYFDRTKFVDEPTAPTVESTDNVDVVFLIDTTGSMDSYINGVKDKCIEFSNVLKDKGASFRLGLVGFGDLLEKEKPSVYPLTHDVLIFQNQVKKIPRTYGGDIPESSLDSLETGIELIKKSNVQEGSKQIFVLITDAPPHVPTVSNKDIEDIVKMLVDNHIITFVVARRDKESVSCYEPLTRNGGKYYSMNDDFYDILDNIAMSIADLIRL